MDQQRGVILNVPGNDCLNRPMGFTFGPKNMSGIFGLCHLRKTNGDDEQSNHKGGVYVNQLDWMAIDSPAFRQLANELACVFVSNQRTGGTVMTPAEQLHYSHACRAVIKVAIEETRKHLGGSSREQMEELMRMLVIGESAWSIAEIIFFQEPQGGQLLNQLLIWLRSHLDDSRQMMEEILRDEQIEYHHNYWRAILGFILQGSVTEAIQLLQAANDHSQACLAMIDLLKAMPLYQSHSTSVMEFKVSWRHWQQEAKNLVQQRVFLSSEKLSHIAGILSGDKDVIQLTVEDLCLPWYSYMLAETLYTKPYAKLHDLQHSAAVSAERLGGYGSFESHDYIILAVINKSVLDVMRYSSESFSDWWFPVHLADVFYQGGLLHEKNSVGPSMREELLLEYGGRLMQHNSLWPAGVNYLKYCKDYGKYHLQEYLMRISLTSERKALKVLSICEENGFTQQALTVCRVMARRDLQDGRLGAALAWCRHVKDSHTATVVAQRFLQMYKSDGDDCMDVLDALGSTMLISKDLLFLAKLREFHQMCSRKETKDACALLVTLITSRMAPKQYWFLLLLELLPMLESAELFFESDHIYELMNCVAELRQTRLHNLTDDIEQDKLTALQLALTRNLARVTLADPKSLDGINLTQPTPTFCGVH